MTARTAAVRARRRWGLEGERFVSAAGSCAGLFHPTWTGNALVRSASRFHSVRSFFLRTRSTGRTSLQVQSEHVLPRVQDYRGFQRKKSWRSNPQRNLLRPALHDHGRQVGRQEVVAWIQAGATATRQDCLRWELFQLQHRGPRGGLERHPLPARLQRGTPSIARTDELHRSRDGVEFDHRGDRVTPSSHPQRVMAHLRNRKTFNLYATACGRWHTP